MADKKWSNEDLTNFLNKFGCPLLKKREIINPRIIKKEYILDCENYSICENAGVPVIINNTIFETQHCTFMNGKFKPKQLKENISRLLEHQKITSRYNELSKNLEIIIPGKIFSQDNCDEIALQHIFNESIKYDFKNMSKDLIKAILLEIGDENRFNPVKKYLDQVYDGNIQELNELNKLMNTLMTPKSFNKDLKYILIKKWLISCVKAVYNPKGISSHGVLILQGEQGMGKTTWFKNLSPDAEWFKDGATLDPSNKDNILGVIKYWIVELGEIESTFKKDLDHLKAFITKDFDELRRPYARTESKYPRRTIFCGSVNNTQFLKDETGNRRFWTIPVEQINYNYTGIVNIKKLWAEIIYLEKMGELWYLTKQEESLLADSNKTFEVKTYIDTLIDAEFLWNKKERYWMKASDIFAELGKGKELSAEKIGRALKKRGVTDKTLAGRIYYSMPKIKNTYHLDKWEYKQADDDIQVIFG